MSGQLIALVCVTAVAVGYLVDTTLQSVIRQLWPNEDDRDLSWVSLLAGLVAGVGTVYYAHAHHIVDLGTLV